MSEPVVELRDVWLTLGRQLVLRGVDLSVPRGESIAVIGPNGGGKTTLLRLLVGLLRPDRGFVRVLGRDPEAARGLVGYVPQRVRFDMDFPIRVIDVVAMGRLRRAGLLTRLSAADEQVARDALEQLEIAHLAERRVGSLSGGQLQRVLIARAVAVEPQLLLLDEPTASLDVHSAAAFYELLNRLARRMTVMISTHDVTGIAARVGGIACLNRELFFHPAGELSAARVAEVYGCPVELIGHGVPHRVLGEHGAGGEEP
jgi:zinc transport system ATP-binding protein